MKTLTRTQSVTTTQLAIATAALFAAGSIALAAAPVAKNNTAKVFLNPSKSVQSLKVDKLCGNNREIKYNVAQVICKGGKIQSSTKSCKTLAQIKTAAESFCIARIPAALKPAPQIPPAGYGYGYNPPVAVAGPNYHIVLADVFNFRFTGNSSMTYTVRLSNTGNQVIPDTNDIPGSDNTANNGIRKTYLDVNMIPVTSTGEMFSSIQQIAPGSSYTQNYLEPNLPPSARYMKFHIDSFNILPETDENDNMIIVPIPQIDPNAEDPQVR